MSAISDLEAGLAPEALVPGDVASIRALARNCALVADQLAATYRGLDYIELTGADWTGAAAEAYFLLRDVDLTRFRRAASAFDDAAGALHDYLRCLRACRGQAATAKARYEDGKRRQAADLASCTPPPPPPSALVRYDPYGLAAAADLLDDARATLRRGAGAAARILRDAAALAPLQARLVQMPPASGQGGSLADVVTSPWHLVHGFGKGMAGALTSMGDWFMPPGAPAVGSGPMGELDAASGMAESSGAAFTLFDTGLLVEGPLRGAVRGWRLNSWVRTNVQEISPRISRQAQARHVFGTPQWLDMRGGYFLSSEDAQQVLDAYRNGEVTILGRKRDGAIVFRYDDVVGFNQNKTAGFSHQPTHVFFIKGTRKVSVVPTSPTAGAVR